VFKDASHSIGSLENIDEILSDGLPAQVPFNEYEQIDKRQTHHPLNLFITESNGSAKPNESLIETQVMLNKVNTLEKISERLNSNDEL
jgi:hypothetical protein